MDIIKVKLAKRSYNIYIGENLISKIGKFLKEYNFGKKIVIVSNPKINSIYGNLVKKSLISAKFEANITLVPDGERYKTLFWASKLYNTLANFQLDRQSWVLALGGGVIDDLAGFVAATYMRGINLVQIPTSLLAQVDSSVGGKVAVNHPKGKNLIGIFWQPKFVLIDVKTLSTLPKRELKTGLAEVIKYGVIKDKNLFSYLQRNVNKILNLQSESLGYILKRSCEIKTEIVQQDEREQNLRMILNYGHTLGHAIETVTHYKKYVHGEAVAIGMTGAANIAFKLGVCKKEIVEEQTELLKRIGLPTKIGNININKIIQSLYLDKKVKNGKIRFILPVKLGEIVINDKVPIDLVKEVLQKLKM